MTAHDIIAKAINDHVLRFTREADTCLCAECGWELPIPNDGRAHHLHVAEQAEADLASDGYAIVNAAEHQQQLAAIADWQRSALTVIEAANAFLLDMVTGDGDPTILAAAMVESGFDQRFPAEYAKAGYAIVKLPEPNGTLCDDPAWQIGAHTVSPNCDGTVYLGLVLVPERPTTAAVARELAAALLATAAHAEQVADD